MTSGIRGHARTRPSGPTVRNRRPTPHRMSSAGRGEAGPVGSEATRPRRYTSEMVASEAPWPRGVRSPLARADTDGSKALAAPSRAANRATASTCSAPQTTTGVFTRVVTDWRRSLASARTAARQEPGTPVMASWTEGSALKTVTSTHTGDSAARRRQASRSSLDPLVKSRSAIPRRRRWAATSQNPR